MFKLTNYAAVIRLADRAFCWPGSPGYADYLKWVERGGVPIQADPLPTPPDLADADNQQKVARALLLCIAEVGGLTVQQVKALFRQKWGLLP